MPTDAERAEIADRIARDPDKLGVPGKSMVGEPPTTAQPLNMAPTVGADAPATKEQRDGYLARAAKILRDTLEAKAKVKREEAGPMMKAYILKQSGAADVKKITTATWERILSALESITDPAAVAAKVREGTNDNQR